MAKILGDVGLEIIADRISIPVRGGKQALNAIGGCGADMFSGLPAMLALEWADQVPQISINQLTRFGAHKLVRNA